MTTTIASASVRITADVAALRAEIEAGVRSAVAGVDPSVNVNADTAAADAKLDDTALKADRLGAKSVTVDVRTDASHISEAEQGLSGIGLAAASIGPALIPAGAAAVGFAGTAVSAFGAVALGAGVVALAFGQIKTTIGNEVEPALHSLQTTAAAGILPGLQSGIHVLLADLPQVRGLVGSVAAEMGKLASEGGHALAGPEFKSFFTYLNHDAAPILDEFGHVIGNVARIGANVAVAFAPLTREIGSGLESLTGRLAASSASSSGLEHFIAYVQTEGPAVVHTFESLGTSVGHVLTSLVPVGDATLSIVHGFSDIVSHTPAPIIDVIAIRFGAMAVATKLATTAMKFFGASEATATAAAGPLGLAIAAAVTAFTGYEQIKQGNAEATLSEKNAADQYVTSLHTVLTSQKSVATSTNDIRVKMAQLAVAQLHVASQSGGLFPHAYAATIGELGTKLKQTTVASQQAQTNARGLAAQYGLTYHQVVQLAGGSSHLVGTYGQVAARFRSVYQAAQATHHPLTDVGKDVQVLGNKAATADQQLTALTDLLAKMAGNTFAADQSTLSFREGLKTLRDALNKSNDSMSASKPAGQQARQAFINVAQNAIASAAAIEKQTGSVSKARAALQTMIAQLRNSAGNSKFAQQGIDLLKNAMDNIPNSAKNAQNATQNAAGQIASAAGKAAGQAVTALKSQTGNATTAGAEFSQGYATGISNGQNAAVNAAAQLAAAAVAAARASQQSKSPSKVMHKVGTEATQGYTAGITDSTPAAASAATSMVNTTMSAAAKAAAAKAAQVRKATTTALSSIDQYIKTTFGSELAGSPHQIDLAVHGLEYRLHTADRNNQISTKTRNLINDELDRTRTSLVGLSQASAKVSKELSAASSHLSTLRSDAANVRTSALSSFQGLGDPSQWEGLTSIGGVLSLLGTQDQTAQSFKANLAQARSEGLDKRAYNQLVAGGPEQDSQIAQLLANATKAQIRQFNREEGVLDQTGRQVGRSSAQYLYGHQIAVARREVHALRVETHTLRQDQRHLINLLQKLVKAQVQGSGKGEHRLEHAIRNVGHDVAAALNGTASRSKHHHRGRVAGAHG